MKKELISRNPLRFMGHDENDDILPAGGFGAVLARAGLGKTAILVQIALDSLLREKNVLHISLTDSVKKVCLWYEEVFRNTAELGEQVSEKTGRIEELWESLLPQRLIMTFKVDSFSAPKLEERLTDLTEQNIFHPRILLIDGLQFDETARTTLTDLKRFAENRSMSIWFTINIHRHETTGPDEIPAPLVNVADLFDVAIQLAPEEKEIRLKVIKGISDYPLMLLDPSTMLIKA